MIKHLNLRCAGQPPRSSLHQQRTIFDPRGHTAFCEALHNKEGTAAEADSASDEVSCILRQRARRPMPVGVTLPALP